MAPVTVTALRSIMTIVLAGTVFFQVLFVAMLFAATDAPPMAVRAPIVAVLVLGIATIQVTTVGVWRLLTMVARGTVFSEPAFRYVDLIKRAVAAASVLLFALGTLMATLPLGDDVPPGIILIIGGGGVVMAGIALIVHVLRMMLAQAIARDDEAQRLSSELEDVI